MVGRARGVGNTLWDRGHGRSTRKAFTTEDTEAHRKSKSLILSQVREKSEATPVLISLSARRGVIPCGGGCSVWLYV
jgi:hypothetical protein